MNPGSASSTQGWTNGADQMTCDNYARLWCENGDARPGQEWALDRPQYRQPRLNCCVCGKKGCDAVPTLTPTLTHQVDKSSGHSRHCALQAHTTLSQDPNGLKGVRMQPSNHAKVLILHNARKQARTHARIDQIHSLALSHSHPLAFTRARAR